METKKIFNCLTFHDKYDRPESVLQAFPQFFQIDPYLYPHPPCLFLFLCVFSYFFSEDASFLSLVCLSVNG